MKKAFVLWCMLCMTLGVWAADPIVINGLRYLLNEDNLTATVARDLRTNRPEATYKGEINIPSTVTIGGKTYTVTTIGGSAFQDSTGITKITIPGTVTTIEGNAFRNTSITSITIPASVTSIGNSPFSGCNKLDSARFGSYQSLCNMNFSEPRSNPLSIAKHLFIGNNKEEETFLNIPEGVTTIKKYVFQNLPSVTGISMPKSMSTVEEIAFNISSSVFNKAVFASDSSLCAINYSRRQDNPIYMARSIYYASAPDNEVKEVIIPKKSLRDGHIIRKFILAGASSIETVHIPEGADYVEQDAFSECSKLKKAVFPSEEALCSMNYPRANENPIYSAHYIYYANDLTNEVKEVSIPEKSLADGHIIRKYILAGASSLERVNIPEKATYIEVGAFLDCKSLKYANYYSIDQAITIMEYANETANPLYYASQLLVKDEFPSDITITKDVKPNAFTNAKWLRTVKFGENVKEIGAQAFSGCEKLSLVEFESYYKLKSIGAKAFSGCKNLPSIELPSSVEYIGDNAFENCPLTTISIPDNCVIGNSLFRYCSQLKSAKLPNSITKVPANTFEYCFNLTSVVLPESVDSIDSKAFSNCKSLQQVPMTSSLAYIGQNAFTNCLGFTDIILTGNGAIKEIDSNAFDHCENVTMVRLPETITYIRDNVFANCYKLQDVYSEKKEVPTTDTRAFAGNENSMALHVESAEVQALYQEKEPWKNFNKSVVKHDAKLLFFINDRMIQEYSQESGTLIDKENLPDLSKLPTDSIFSGWDQEIPTTMPSDDTNFYGYISVVKNIGDFTYLLEPNYNGIPAHATIIGVAKELTASDSELALVDEVKGTEIIYPYNTEMIPAVYPVTKIGNKAFENKTYVTKITLPASKKIKEIENAAFKGCSKLHTIENFDCVTTVADSLFMGCAKLQQIMLNDNVTSIGREAFSGCSTLDPKTLPSKLNTIGYQAFAGAGLTEITIPEKVKTMNNQVFKSCTKLEKIDFKTTISLPSRTFWGCNNLKQFTLTGTNIEIGEGAFLACSSLVDLNLPEGVKLIQDGAFKYCQNIETVHLPASLDGMGSEVFNGCTKLNQIIVNKEKAPFGPKDAFDKATYDTCYVFVEKPDNYKIEPWKNFKYLSVQNKNHLIYKVDGKVVADSLILVGTHLTARPDSVLAGHRFSGWQGEPKIMPAKDTIVNGNFLYYVKYYEETLEGQLLHKDSLTCGETIVVPEDKLQKKDHIINKLENLVETMPNKDINVLVKYQVAEKELTKDGVTYKVYVLKDSAEVISAATDRTSYTIPEKITLDEKQFPVKVIRENVFRNNSMNSLTIQAKLVAIGDNAFLGCKKLTSLTLPETLDSIGNGAFKSTGLTSITIPASVTKLGEDMFIWSASITSVDFKAHVNKVPRNMFQNCLALKEITLPGTVTTIDDYAFEGCNNLSLVTLGSQLTKIGNGAFKGCNKLNALSLPATVKSIGEFAFLNAFVEDGTLELKGTTLPTAYYNSFETIYNHVALSTKLKKNQLTDPWHNFAVVEDRSVVQEQCATPKISVSTGKIKVTCDTKGAQITTNVDVKSVENTHDAEFDLPKTFIIKSYATKENFKKSETATYEFEWIPGDINGDKVINILDVTTLIDIILGNIKQ